MANVGNEPQNCPDIEDDSRPDQSLLDHFAGLAMLGYAHNPETLRVWLDFCKKKKMDARESNKFVREQIAEMSYSQAAAMVAERKRIMEQP